MCTIAVNLHLTGRKVQIKSTIERACFVWRGAFAGSAASSVTNSSTSIAPDSQKGPHKSQPSQKFTPDRQTGADKIHETQRFLGLAYCFCWVGGVERYEHSYVRHCAFAGSAASSVTNSPTSIAPDSQKGPHKS